MDPPVARFFKIVGYTTALLSLSFGLSHVWSSATEYLTRRAQITQLLASSEIQRTGLDYRGAWESLAKAAAVQNTPDVLTHQEDLAMEWLRNIHAKDEETFTSTVKIVSPLLTAGVAQHSGVRKADLLAHLGWGDFLKLREGNNEVHPDSYYRQALEIDPSNVFAHTFIAHWILWNRGPVSEAAEHFRAALDSGRERKFVREYQLASLLNNARLDDNVELLRVAAEMVRNSETISHDIQERIFNYTYWNSRHDPEMREAFLKSLNVEDHLKMFMTLYGPGADASIYHDNEKLRDFWLASLLEANGKTAEALAQYQRVHNEFERESKTSRVYREEYIQAAEQAVKRLSSLPNPSNP